MQGSRAFFTIAVFAGTLARPQLCSAQARPYFGAVGGVSTLSADASTAINAGSAAASSYKPENGPTVGVFGGLHWTNYFSVQADYVWNRNLLTLDSLAASTTGANTKLFEETSRSRQQSALGSALLYFRPRSSWVRPFLSVGTGVVHLTADPRSAGTVSGLIPP